MEYSHNFGSQFPESVLTIEERKDVDDTVKEYMTQYDTLYSAGDFDGAQAILNAHMDVLAPYLISSEDMNKWQEEIHNLGVGLMKSIQTIISETEPEGAEDGSHWLKEF